MGEMKGKETDPGRMGIFICLLDGMSYNVPQDPPTHLMWRVQSELLGLMV